MKVVTETGNIVESAPYSAADRLVNLRNTKTLWEVVAEVVKVWEQTKVKQYRSHLIDLQDKKETRLNKHGSNKDKSLRYIVDVPEDIIRMLRILYDVEDLPMDKPFFRMFGKKFPQYKVAEKI